MKSHILIFLCLLFFSCSKQTDTRIAQKAEDISPLLIGEVLPKANLKNAKGETVDLQNLIQQKPTVLVFYRGGWCPYCNSQLSGLAKIEKEILDLGYQVVAVSPDSFENLQNIGENEKLNYQVLSDPNGELIKKVGIAFETPLIIKGYLVAKNRKGETSEVIPVPTVMVLDKEGKILFEYINPDYKVRITSEMLLAVLKALQTNV